MSIPKTVNCLRHIAL